MALTHCGVLGKRRGDDGMVRGRGQLSPVGLSSSMPGRGLGGAGTASADAIVLSSMREMPLGLLGLERSAGPCGEERGRERLPLRSWAGGEASAQAGKRREGGAGRARGPEGESEGV
jgi:hypothetical protein